MMQAGANEKLVEEQWAELPSANYDKWSRYDLWTLTEFAYLLINKEPIKELWPFNVHEFDTHYKVLETQALRSEKVRKLTPEGRTWDGDMPFNREYLPCVLIRWADLRRVSR